MTGGSHLARECLMAFTPWHLDAVSGSHPPHLLMAQTGHRQVAQLAPDRQSLEVMTLLASVVAAASESLLIVRQYALDYVEQADYHIRPSLIG